MNQSLRSHDEPRLAAISPGLSLRRKAPLLALQRDRIRRLIELIGRPGDLAPRQWVQLMAFALDFEPDLILELGRGWGNSTAAFTEAANMLIPSCEVVSVCRSRDFQQKSQDRLMQVMGESWFGPLKVISGDILAQDYQQLVGKHQRVFIFWDAHGFDIAECVLGEILPYVAHRPHIVVMHDISDARYASGPASYQGKPLWRHGKGEAGPTLRLGPISTRVEQAIAAVDFTSRNNVPFNSADESLHREIGADPAEMEKLDEILGKDLFALQADWFWFSLNSAPGGLTFPAFRPSGRSLRWKVRAREAAKIVMGRT